MPKGVFQRKPFTLEHRRNLSISHLGQKSWNKGKKTGLIPRTAFKKGDIRITGKNHYNWKGGRGFDGLYIRMRVGANKRQREHRFIMEKLLGRKLERHEVVHHINHNKLDNSVENLELMTNSQHTKLHSPHLKHHNG